MDVLKIGLVGVGGMGSVHYHNFKEIEGCAVTAVVGSSQRVRDTAAGWGLPCYPSISEMVANEDIDIVDICTPTFTHHDLVMESLKCKKHTICEKPIALSFNDAKEMLDEKDNLSPFSIEIEFTAAGAKDLDEINQAVLDSAMYLREQGFEF